MPTAKTDVGVIGDIANVDLLTRTIPNVGAEEEGRAQEEERTQEEGRECTDDALIYFGVHHLTPTNLTTPNIDADRNCHPAVPLGSQEEGRTQEEDCAEEEGCDQEEDRRQEEVNSSASSIVCDAKVLSG